MELWILCTIAGLTTGIARGFLGWGAVYFNADKPMPFHKGKFIYTLIYYGFAGAIAGIGFNSVIAAILAGANLELIAKTGDKLVTRA